MKSIPLVFDDVHGENVSRTRRGKSVSWKHSYSGGLVFSDVRLEDGDVVKLTLQGSTNADIGFTLINPEEISDLKNAIKEEQISFVGNVGINKDTYKVRLQRQQHSIIYKYGKLQTTYNIDGEDDQPVWIAVYLQFGKCNLKLYDKDKSAVRWHNQCGKNIQFEDRIIRHRCTLFDENPAAFACVRLNPTATHGIRMKIRIRSASEVLTPSSFSVYTSNVSPSCLQRQNSHLFAVVEPLSDTECEGITYLKTFECNPKNTKCYDGMLEIGVFASGITTFKHSSEGSTVAKIRTNSSDQVTMLFKLSSVNLEIMEAFEIPHEQDVEDSSDDASSVTSDESSFVIATGSELEEETTTELKRKRSFQRPYSLTEKGNRNEASQPPFKRGSSDPCLRMHFHTTSSTIETLGNIVSTEIPNVQRSIQQNYVYLVQNLQAFPLCDHLFENEILTFTEQQKIRKMERMEPSDDVNRELLGMLQSKNVSPTLMKNALSKSGLTHIVDKFNTKTAK